MKEAAWEKYLTWPECSECKHGIAVEKRTGWPIPCPSCTPFRERAIKNAKAPHTAARKKGADYKWRRS